MFGSQNSCFQKYKLTLKRILLAHLIIPMITIRIKFKVVRQRKQLFMHVIHRIVSAKGIRYYQATLIAHSQRVPQIDRSFSE